MNDKQIKEMRERARSKARKLEQRVLLDKGSLNAKQGSQNVHVKQSACSETGGDCCDGLVGAISIMVIFLAIFYGVTMFLFVSCAGVTAPEVASPEQGIAIFFILFLVAVCVGLLLASSDTRCEKGVRGSQVTQQSSTTTTNNNYGETHHHHYYN